MPSLPERNAPLLAGLHAAGSPDAILRALMQRADREQGLPPHARTDTQRVAGCLSQLWIAPHAAAGRCYFRCDSDARIVKAVAGLLCEYYSDATPAEILACPPEFLRALGLAAHLTANRRNALSRVWETIQTFARQQPETEPPPGDAPLEPAP